MINTILTAAALLATTALAGPGSAIVINSCSYDVQLSNTPSAGGGYDAINKVLSPGGSYSQVYTQLTNGNGWSLKLAKTANFISDVLQYEYTYHADGTIWYDLSEVNGNPWDANWEITATSGCTPRQAAYRYSTDDAYGMQSCADTASITVTLCSGTSGGGAPSSPSKAATPSWGLGNKVVESPAGDVAVHKHKAPPAPEAPTSEAPAPEAPTSEAPAPTPATDGWNGPAVTVTNIAYETVTEVVTATAHPHKRHVHHPRHPHGLR